MTQIPPEILRAHLTREQIATVEGLMRDVAGTVYGVYDEIEDWRFKPTTALLVWQIAVMQAAVVHGGAYIRFAGVPVAAIDGISESDLARMWEADMYRTGVFFAMYHQRLDSFEDPLYRAAVGHFIIEATSEWRGRWRDVRNATVVEALESGVTRTDLAKALDVSRPALDKFVENAKPGALAQDWVPYPGSTTADQAPLPLEHLAPSGQVPRWLLLKTIPVTKIMPLMSRGREVVAACEDAFRRVDEMDLTVTQQYLAWAVMVQESAAIHREAISRLMRVPAIRQQHHDPETARTYINADRGRTELFFIESLRRILAHPDPAFRAMIAHRFAVWIDDWERRTRARRNAYVDDAVMAGVPVNVVADTLGITRQAVLQARNAALKDRGDRVAVPAWRPARTA